MPEFVTSRGTSLRRQCALEMRLPRSVGPIAADRLRSPLDSNSGSRSLGNNGAGGEDRTPDLRFTKPLHYRCATPAPAPGLPATRQSRKRVLGPDRHDRQSKKRAPPCGALQIVDPLGSARLLSVGGEDI